MLLTASYLLFQQLTFLGFIVKPLNIEVIIAFIIIIVLLVASALMSGSEVAFFSLTPSDMEKLQNLETKKDKAILLLLENPKRLLATLLIGNNFVNIGIVILSTFITVELFDFSSNLILGFLIQVVVISFIILLFGEILPKVYATQHALSTSKSMAYPLGVLQKLFWPLSIVLISSTSIIDKRFVKRGHSISIDDLSHALDLTANNDTKTDENKMLRGIVNFGEIDVKEVMTSRIDVTAVNIETNFHELLTTVLESGYSRIPVYRNTFDKVEGVLYTKDLLPHIEKEKEYKWYELLRPAFFVPESKMINDLLEEFQRRKNHFAIVVDEYGGTSGIITLEDIIEEIVGEINDEFDSEEIVHSHIDRNIYVFEAKTSINNFCKILAIDPKIFDDAKGDSDTLAGLLLELEGKIPERNDIIQFKNYIFKIEAVDKRRIKRVRVTIKEESIKST